MDNECNTSFKVVLTLYIALTLYLFAKDSVSTSMKFGLLLFLYIALYMDYKMDKLDKSMSGEHFTSDDGLTRRQRKIKELNDNRNTEGRFYVNCHSCGRDRVLDDKFNNLRRRYMRSREMCMSPCTVSREKTMGYFNEKFVDSSKIFCYNCLIDSDEKNRAYEQDYGGSYLYWPTLEDPVNGPPHV